MLTAKDVSQRLSTRAEDVAAYLLPNGTRKGNEWCVGNIDGDHGKSLKVNLSGFKAGIWCDFATGASGDLIDLWALKRGLNLKFAIKEACDYLGIKNNAQIDRKENNFTRPSAKLLSSFTGGFSAQGYLIKTRLLTNETVEAYKITTHRNFIVFLYIRDDVVIFVKYLCLDRSPDGKKTMRVEKNCEPCLFGWHLIPDNAREVTICEGEIDAMSLYQLGIAALSLPLGAGSKKHEWIDYDYDRLAVFDKIYLCLDNDDAGKITTADLLVRLGQERCVVVHLPLKDANECLQAGMSSDEIKVYFDNAQGVDPPEMKCAGSIPEKLCNWLDPSKRDGDGYRAPWAKAKDKILFRPAEFCVWTGINGHGKSQFVGQIILSMMSQGAKVFLASLEMSDEVFLGRIARQASGISNQSKEYTRAISDWFKNKLWYVDVLGAMSLDRLLELFLYGKRRYGIDVFVIDPFMMLNGVYEDDLKSQHAAIQKIVDFKNKNRCQVHLIVHPRKGVDEKVMPGKMDVKGSGTITDAADSCFVIWRNQRKEEIAGKKEDNQMLSSDEEKRLLSYDCYWSCVKQRQGDWQGTIGLWFDKNSYQYLEFENDKPKRYVHLQPENG